MNMKTIPIKFNNEQIRDLEDLQDLLGTRGTYGAVPRAVKLGVKLAIAKIEQERQELSKQIIPSLNSHEKQLYLASISRPAKEEIEQELKQSRPKKANKV